MSSAYIRQDICKPQLPSGTGSHWSSKHFDKSFRYNEKKVVLRTQPCLTPILVSKELLKTFSVFYGIYSFFVHVFNNIQKWAFDIVFTHFMKECLSIDCIKCLTYVCSGHFLGFKILNFNIFWDFQIFFGVIIKLD